MDWGDLPIIDLSLAGTEEGRARLGEQVRDALMNTGFFYVVNHGYSQEQVYGLFSSEENPELTWKQDKSDL